MWRQVSPTQGYMGSRLTTLVVACALCFHLCIATNTVMVRRDYDSASPMITYPSSTIDGIIPASSNNNFMFSFWYRGYGIGDGSTDKVTASSKASHHSLYFERSAAGASECYWPTNYHPKTEFTLPACETSYYWKTRVPEFAKNKFYQASITSETWRHDQQAGVSLWAKILDIDGGSQATMFIQAADSSFTEESVSLVITDADGSFKGTVSNHEGRFPYTNAINRSPANNNDDEATMITGQDTGNVAYGGRYLSVYEFGEEVTGNEAIRTINDNSGDSWMGGSQVNNITFEVNVKMYWKSFKITTQDNVDNYTISCVAPNTFTYLTHAGGVISSGGDKISVIRDFTGSGTELQDEPCSRIRLESTVVDGGNPLEISMFSIEPYVDIGAGGVQSTAATTTVSSIKGDDVFYFSDSKATSAGYGLRTVDCSSVHFGTCGNNDFITNVIDSNPINGSHADPYIILQYRLAGDAEKYAALKGRRLWWAAGNTNPNKYPKDYLVYRGTSATGPWELMYEHSATYTPYDPATCTHPYANGGSCINAGGSDDKYPHLDMFDPFTHIKIVITGIPGGATGVQLGYFRIGYTQSAYTPNIQMDAPAPKKTGVQSSGYSGQWMHMALVKYSTSNYYKLYRDGKIVNMFNMAEEAFGLTSQSFTPLMANPSTMNIGGRSSGDGDTHTSALVRDVRIFQNGIPDFTEMFKLNSFSTAPTYHWLLEGTSFTSAAIGGLTLSAPSTTPTTSKSRYVLNFPTGAEYAELAGATQFDDCSTTFQIEAWAMVLKPQYQAEPMFIWLNEGSTAGHRVGFGLAALQTYELHGYYDISSTSTVSANMTDPIQPYEWMYFEFTVTSTPSLTYSIYSTMESGEAVLSTVSGVATPATCNMAGGNDPRIGVNFVGYIAEVRYWNNNPGTDQRCSFDYSNNLVGLWRFDGANCDQVDVSWYSGSPESAKLTCNNSPTLVQPDCDVNDVWTPHFSLELGSGTHVFDIATLSSTTTTNRLDGTWRFISVWCYRDPSNAVCKFREYEGSGELTQLHSISNTQGATGLPAWAQTSDWTLMSGVYAGMLDEIRLWKLPDTSASTTDMDTLFPDSYFTNNNAACSYCKYGVIFGSLCVSEMMDESHVTTNSVPRSDIDYLVAYLHFDVRGSQPIDAILGLNSATAGTSTLSGFVTEDIGGNTRGATNYFHRRDEAGYTAGTCGGYSFQCTPDDCGNRGSCNRNLGLCNCNFESLGSACGEDNGGDGGLFVLTSNAGTQYIHKHYLDGQILGTLYTEDILLSNDKIHPTLAQFTVAKDDDSATNRAKVFFVGGTQSTAASGISFAETAYEVNTNGAVLMASTGQPSPTHSLVTAYLSLASDKLIAFVGGGNGHRVIFSKDGSSWNAIDPGINYGEVSHITWDYDNHNLWWYQTERASAGGALVSTRIMNLPCTSLLTSNTVGSWCGTVTTYLNYGTTPLTGVDYFAENVYWANGTHIVRAPYTSSSSTTVLGSAAVTITSIAVTSDYVFYTDGTDVYKLQVSTATTSLVSSPGGTVQHIRTLNVLCPKGSAGYCSYGYSGQGTCNFNTGQCICNPRFGGDTCSEPALEAGFVYASGGDIYRRDTIWSDPQKLVERTSTTDQALHMTYVFEPYSAGSIVPPAKPTLAGVVYYDPDKTKIMFAAIPADQNNATRALTPPLVSSSEFDVHVGMTYDRHSGYTWYRDKKQSKMCKIHFRTKDHQCYNEPATIIGPVSIDQSSQVWHCQSDGLYYCSSTMSGCNYRHRYNTTMHTCAGVTLRNSGYDQYNTGSVVEGMLYLVSWGTTTVEPYYFYFSGTIDYSSQATLHSGHSALPGGYSTSYNSGAPDIYSTKWNNGHLVFSEMGSTGAKLIEYRFNTGNSPATAIERTGLTALAHTQFDVFFEYCGQNYADPLATQCQGHGQCDKNTGYCSCDNTYASNSPRVDADCNDVVFSSNGLPVSGGYLTMDVNRHIIEYLSDSTTTTVSSIHKNHNVFTANSKMKSTLPIGAAIPMIFIGDSDGDSMWRLDLSASLLELKKWRRTKVACMAINTATQKLFWLDPYEGSYGSIKGANTGDAASETNGGTVEVALTATTGTTTWHDMAISGYHFILAYTDAGGSKIRAIELASPFTVTELYTSAATFVDDTTLSMGFSASGLIDGALIVYSSQDTIYHGTLVHDLSTGVISGTESTPYTYSGAPRNIRGLSLFYGLDYALTDNNDVPTVDSVTTSTTAVITSGITSGYRKRFLERVSCPGSPSCSGHGTCPVGSLACECDTTWSGFTCSLAGMVYNDFRNATSSTFIIVDDARVPVDCDIEYAPKNLGGVTRTNNNCLRMTSGEPSKASGFFTAKPEYVDASSGFESIFEVLFSGNETDYSCVYNTAANPRCSRRGGDGFAFILHYDPRWNTTYFPIGGDGMEMGYGGISNSLAIEFDTFHNFEQGDLWNNHISVHSNGTFANGADHQYSLGGTSGIPELLDGEVHTVRIAYYPHCVASGTNCDTPNDTYFKAKTDTHGASTFTNLQWRVTEHGAKFLTKWDPAANINSGIGHLSVWIDNILDSDTPVITVPLNLHIMLDLPTLAGRGNVYAGFTAGTGSLNPQTVDILNWQMCFPDCKGICEVCNGPPT